MLASSDNKGLRLASSDNTARASRTGLRAQRSVQADGDCMYKLFRFAVFVVCTVLAIVRLVSRLLRKKQVCCFLIQDVVKVPYSAIIRVKSETDCNLSPLRIAVAMSYWRSGLPPPSRLTIRADDNFEKNMCSS